MGSALREYSGSRGIPSGENTSWSTPVRAAARRCSHPRAKSGGHQLRLSAGTCTPRRRGRSSLAEGLVGDVARRAATPSLPPSGAASFPPPPPPPPSILPDPFAASFSSLTDFDSIANRHDGSSLRRPLDTVTRWPPPSGEYRRPPSSPRPRCNNCGRRWGRRARRRRDGCAPPRRRCAPWLPPGLRLRPPPPAAEPSA